MGYRLRKQGLRVRRTDDGGLIVYDEFTDEGHVLNAAQAVVYDACDGVTTLTDMADQVARQTGLPADEEIVLLALAHLRQAGLLDDSQATTAALARVNPGLTRRSLLKRLAVGAGALALLPTIDSIGGVSRLAAETGLSVFAAISISISTSQGVPVTVQLGATGAPAEAGTLSFVVVTPPQNGTASISGSLLTYTPSVGFQGTDTLTYQAMFTPGATTPATTGGTTPATTPSTTGGTTTLSTTGSTTPSTTAPTTLGGSSR